MSPFQSLLIENLCITTDKIFLNKLVTCINFNWRQYLISEPNFEYPRRFTISTFQCNGERSFSAVHVPRPVKVEVPVRVPYPVEVPVEVPVKVPVEKPIPVRKYNKFLSFLIL